MHWDDDDWYALSWVRRQAVPLVNGLADATAASTYYCVDRHAGRGYRYPFDGAQEWVSGNDLSPDLEVDLELE